MIDVGRLVTTARQRAGFATIYGMAKATGLPIKTISDIEAGLSSPSINTLARIMDAIEWKLIVEFKRKS